MIFIGFNENALLYYITNMDAVHEADEPVDIGVCNTHNRVFECYCTQCYT